MNAFADRLIPDTFEILGLSLKPFSIGHALRMQKENCAFIQEGSTVDVNDLILGLCICSRTYKEFDEWLEDEGAKNWCAKWGNIFMEMVDAEVEQDKGDYISDEWKRFVTYKRILNRESKKFMEYMKHGIKEPFHIKENQSNQWMGGATVSNPYMNLRHLLITKMGYHADNVMDVSVSLGIADFYKHQESEGAITIIEW